MRKLLLAAAPFMSLAVAAPAFSQGAQTPTAPNATPPSGTVQTPSAPDVQTPPAPNASNSSRGEATSEMPSVTQTTPEQRSR